MSSYSQGIPGAADKLVVEGRHTQGAGRRTQDTPGDSHTQGSQAVARPRWAGCEGRQLAGGTRPEADDASAVPREQAAQD